MNDNSADSGDHSDGGDPSKVKKSGSVAEQQYRDAMDKTVQTELKKEMLMEQRNMLM
jgi:hypothetical protein